MRTDAVVLLALLLAALPPAGARAESSDPEACLRDDLCRTQYTLARELSKSGNLDEAIAAYETAYQRRPVPILLYNIGRLHHRLRHYADAVRYYSRYLETQAQEEAEQRARARQYLEDATKELQQGPAPTREPTREPTLVPLLPAAAQPTPTTASVVTPAEPPAVRQTAVPQTVAPLASQGPQEPAAAPREKVNTPLYKRWWLWALVGGVVVAGAVGLGVGLGMSQPAAAPGAMSLPPGLHTYEPTF
jgi:hypothetical protein